MTIFYKRSNKNTTKDEYLEKTDVVLFFPATGMDIKGASITLPLSLLCISAPLIEKGFKVKIIDQRLDNDWKKTLSKTIKDKPLCVGITAMTGKQINGAISASKLIKKINKSIPVVWGGAHASLLPEQTINNPFVDIVVVGEGEETFIELIERLKNGKMLKDVQGIFYKDSLNQIFRTKTRAFTNLDQLPNLP